jgi:hypothetical protein
VHASGKIAHKTTRPSTKSSARFLKKHPDISTNSPYPHEHIYKNIRSYGAMAMAMAMTAAVRILSPNCELARIDSPCDYTTRSNPASSNRRRNMLYKKIVDSNPDSSNRRGNMLYKKTVDPNSDSPNRHGNMLYKKTVDPNPDSSNRCRNMCKKTVDPNPAEACLPTTDRRFCLDTDQPSPGWAVLIFQVGTTRFARIIFGQT